MAPTRNHCSLTLDDYDRSHSAMNMDFCPLVFQLKGILPRHSVDHTLRNPTLPTDKPRNRTAANHNTTKFQTCSFVLSSKPSPSH
ncbi:hypothetical protein HBI56_129900 [Parastagonospora nodorum]|nr:hypothetical protein HBH56_153910 [Parastagonospora nodorum]KAH3926519.1 hypothetical protein HBH54_163770 [Parastagonospora nodorum]KAH3943320.1 hypothetical protein HBH53_175430 [Parastagonospora nodorum]KAH3970416.1 hypothetical protein HBH52_167120 [Parastagonospora nodorum]KAH3972122.1 hypothetical protein HBH51_106100 [Parastagonospora nodorum]